MLAAQRAACEAVEDAGMGAPGRPIEAGGASSKSGAGMFLIPGTEESSSLDFPSFSSLSSVDCSVIRAVWALLSSLPCDGAVVEVVGSEDKRDDAMAAGDGGVVDGNVSGGGTLPRPDRAWGIYVLMPP